MPVNAGGGAMLILLVEDDDLVRAVLAEFLGDAGHEVLETGDPHLALGLPQAVSPPDVLVTDVDLCSELNGFDVAANAHGLWPEVRVIFISALPDGRNGQSLDPRDRYIQKPFSGERLIGTIEQMAKEV
jgi:CheY-like chemotaxis protein